MSAAASASVAKSRERRVTAGRRIDDEYIHGEDIEEVSIGDITLLVLTLVLRLPEACRKYIKFNSHPNVKLGFSLKHKKRRLFSQSHEKSNFHSNV